MDNSFSILIGGEAGQGLVTIGDILAKVLARSGYYIFVTKSYQSRIRGGHNTYAIRFASGKIEAPQEPIDILVALNEETINTHANEVAKKGFIIAGNNINLDDERLISVPYKELAEKGYVNTVALGVVSAIIGITEKLLVDSVNMQFGKKGKEEDASKNLDIIRRTYKWIAAKDVNKGNINPPQKLGEKIILDGNQAIALGAIASGLRFYSFYPMTPSTSVGLEIIKHADEMEIVVEQAEDEIAAINMALGASYAGAPSMVATSGGGFALMVEGTSLAAMTETPIVIVVAQRPGPATGLPTRTEQADLNFIIHAGHGEFPRAVYSPGTVEECFYITRKAFEVSEKYQSPVFILTDQYLADSIRNVDSFDLSDITSISTVMNPKSVSGEYKRFKFSESGVSPRLLPGFSDHLVVVDSDEHEENGHITEDLGIRKLMVEKRIKKFNGMLSERIRPEYSGSPKSDLLLVSWGSTKGAMLEAVDCLSKRGLKIATLFFPQVWPIVSDDFLQHLEKAKRVIMVENNAFGQFGGLIRRETGFEIKEKILKYDGLPITPEYILRYFKE